MRVEDINEAFRNWGHGNNWPDNVATAFHAGYLVGYATASAPGSPIYYGTVPVNQEITVNG
jgi:hypothetical protein